MIHAVHDLDHCLALFARISRAYIDQARIEGDPLATKMRQSGVRGTVDQGSQTGKRSQNHDRPAQTVENRAKTRQEQSWLSYLSQIGTANNQGKQDGEVNRESIPRTDR
jgi:hypothetical protein